jgi:hypothetical protein
MNGEGFVRGAVAFAESLLSLWLQGLSWMMLCLCGHAHVPFLDYFHEHEHEHGGDDGRVKKRPRQSL